MASSATPVAPMAPASPSAVTRRRILFVDDEPMILRGLNAMLRRERRRWDMSFATSGAEALTLIDLGPFDVIVTDMRMPEMDGAELLSAVRDRHPETVRIVLSGFSETQASLRAIPVAHQFVSEQAVLTGAAP